MPNYFKTWSSRLTLLYASLFTISVLVLFGVIYWSAVNFASQDEAEENDVEFQAVVDEAERAGYAQLPRIIDDHLRQRGGTGAAYLLEAPDGRKIAGNVDPLPPREGAVTVTLPSNGHPQTVRAHFYRMPNGDHLLIGQDSGTLIEMQDLIARAFGVTAMTTLLLAVIGGGIVGRSVLRRVETIARTGRAIVAGDLSKRVPLRGTDDEFDHLSTSVNAMLDRIEDLMRGMRQVSNDIAHDLRTPLARLRQRLELARRHKHSVAELHVALEASITQVDSILETFGALLRIAQIDAGTGITMGPPVDLSSLLISIAGDFAPVAEDRGQAITTDIAQNLTIQGDRPLLAQMIVNMLENALRHTQAGASIRLTARRSGAEIGIIVADSGPGIPPAEREKVLRPFYRLEASRTTEGSGLGFSLIAAIVKQHGGKLTLADNDPGLRVTLTFPSRGSA